MKTIFIGRRTQNKECKKIQQLQVGSYLNFRLKLRGPNQIIEWCQMKTNRIETKPQIQNVKYPSNHWSDLTKTSNLS
jgi:hypothetical protein